MDAIKYKIKKRLHAQQNPSRDKLRLQKYCKGQPNIETRACAHFPKDRNLFPLGGA